MVLKLRCFLIFGEKLNIHLVNWLEITVKLLGVLNVYISVMDGRFEHIVRVFEKVVNFFTIYGTRTNSNISTVEKRLTDDF